MSGVLVHADTKTSGIYLKGELPTGKESKESHEFNYENEEHLGLYLKYFEIETHTS